LCATCQAIEFSSNAPEIIPLLPFSRLLDIVFYLNLIFQRQK
ncbi:MAG: hypothetical protein ACI9A7_002393, partial [Cyclobacteriaceae bacterium]